MLARRQSERAGVDVDKKRESQAEQDGRVTSSLAGLAFVLVLVIVGLLLVRVLKKQSELEDCLMSGRTNCAPIETTR
jgi:hypothetical protein